MRAPTRSSEEDTMNKAIKLGILSALSLAFVAAACSDDDEQATGPGTATRTTTTTTSSAPRCAGTGGVGGGGILAIPTLWQQVDRMGPPAINTATNNTFTDDATRGMAEDAWNANATQTDWVASFAS